MSEIVRVSILIALIVLSMVSPLVLSSNAFAFSTFAMKLGGLDRDDMFRGVEAAPDGGYIVAGTTDSFGAGRRDGWIIKLDEDGSIESQRTYGGRAGDVIRSIRQASDGGFVTAGLSYSFDSGGGDLWMMKFDANQNFQWQRSYGGNGFDMAHTIEPTMDGGYLLAGFTTSFGASGKDYFVIKVDAAGDVVWQKRFGGDGDDVIRIAKQTSDGKYLVAGFTHSFGVRGDIMVLKLASNGDLEWQKSYGGSGFEEPCCILEAPDGYIILEQSVSFSGNTDAWVFKVDKDGDILWQKRHGGTGFDELSSARAMPDGGFIAAGETRSFGSHYEDFWVVRFDSGGNLVWQKHYGGDGVDEAEAIALTPEGGFVVVGTTKSFGAGDEDIWILRLDSRGDAKNCEPNAVAEPVLSAANVQSTTAMPVNTSVNIADTDVSVTAGRPIEMTTDVDGSLQCDITPAQGPLVAVDDSYSTDEDIALNVAHPGVLLNDSTDRAPIEAMMISGPENGEVALSADGSMTYIPDANFEGIDSFSYRVSDGYLYSGEATVTIEVIAVNDAPLALDDSTSTLQGIPVELDVLANDLDVDGDDLEVTLVDSRTSNGGTVAINAGVVTYTGPADWSGVDSFVYVVDDGNGAAAGATVTVTVLAPEPPSISDLD